MRVDRNKQTEKISVSSFNPSSCRQVCVAGWMTNLERRSHVVSGVKQSSQSREDGPWCHDDGYSTHRQRAMSGQPVRAGITETAISSSVATMRIYCCVATCAGVDTCSEQV